MKSFVNFLDINGFRILYSEKKMKNCDKKYALEVIENVYKLTVVLELWPF